MIPEILLAEDDEQIREAMTDFFLDKGADVLHLTTAADGAEALDLIRAKHFDLLILDVMMPNIDGFTLCRQIRAHSDVLILFLTARAREEDSSTAIRSAAMTISSSRSRSRHCLQRCRPCSGAQTELSVSTS